MRASTNDLERPKSQYMGNIWLFLQELMENGRFTEGNWVFVPNKTSPLPAALSYVFVVSRGVFRGELVQAENNECATYSPVSPFAYA